MIEPTLRTRLIALAVLMGCSAIGGYLYGRRNPKEDDELELAYRKGFQDGMVQSSKEEGPSNASTEAVVSRAKKLLQKLRRVDNPENI